MLCNNEFISFLTFLLNFWTECMIVKALYSVFDGISLSGRETFVDFSITRYLAIVLTVLHPLYFSVRIPASSVT